MLGQSEELYREEFTIQPGKSNGKTFQSKFFEQDHLSNLIISGDYARRVSSVHVFQNRK